MKKGMTGMKRNTSKRSTLRLFLLWDCISKASPLKWVKSLNENISPPNVSEA